MSIPEYLKVIAPDAKFTLVTQNVDGLSMEAFRKASPSREPDIFEMHGRLFDTICTVCGHRETNVDSPISSALAATEDNFEHEVEIPLEDLPHCKKPNCSGLLRPGVVWFDEVPHHLAEIGKIVDEADVALIVGTSSTVREIFHTTKDSIIYYKLLQVYPAAGYAYEVAEHGGTVAIFNVERTEGDEDADFLFLGPCEETLPRVLFRINDDEVVEIAPPASL